jgi:hypothetical protein
MNCSEQMAVGQRFQSGDSNSQKDICYVHVVEVQPGDISRGR